MHTGSVWSRETSVWRCAGGASSQRRAGCDLALGVRSALVGPPARVACWPVLRNDARTRSRVHSGARPEPARPVSALRLSALPAGLAHAPSSAQVGALAVGGQRADENPHDGELTFLGRVLAQLPVSLQLGKLIVLGHVFGCLDECLIIGGCRVGRRSGALSRPLTPSVVSLGSGSSVSEEFLCDAFPAAP